MLVARKLPNDLPNYTQPQQLTWWKSLIQWKSTTSECHDSNIIFHSNESTTNINFNTNESQKLPNEQQNLPNKKVSGLPFTCRNCGRSFYSLHTNVKDMVFYCSGECKWSVYMYQEMEKKVELLQAEYHHGSYGSYGSSTADSDYYGSLPYHSNIISFH